MAEYFPLLERAVAGLQTSTPEARKALYERARAALLGQLRTIDPPVPEDDIQRESTELDEAIARVEANARQKDTDHSPPQSTAPPVDAPPAAPAAPVAAAPPPARPPAAPRAAPAGTERIPAPPVPPAAGAPARERPAYPFRNLESGAAPARSAPSVRPGHAPGVEAPGLGSVARERSGSAPRLGAPARIVEPIRPGRPMAGSAAPETGGAAPAPPVLPSVALVSPAVQPPAEPPRESGPDLKVASEPAAQEPEPRRTAGDETPATRGRGRGAAGLRPTVPVQSRREGRGVGLYIALCVGALLVGGVAVAAYVLRDRPEQITAARPEVVIPDPVPGKAVNRVDGSGAASTTGTGVAVATPAGQTDSPSPISPLPQGTGTPEGTADASGVPAPIPQGSERAAKGPQSASPDSVDSPPPPDTAAQADGTRASDAPIIGVSQRAGLLVDAPDDPQKVRTYAGSVVWRVDSVSAGQGQPLSNAVHADIEVPEAKLVVSMVIKKNFEPQFPASHTIEFHFTEQPGNTLGPVKQINVPELRRDDAAQTGDPLIGVPVAITDDYFLVGLSRGAAEQTNVALMTQRNWFDVSILLTSGKIAKVAFEKGPTGEKIIADAVAAWR